MFDTQIAPILEYNSEIWYYRQKCEPTERMHLGYIKHNLMIRKTSCTPALYAETGRFPLALNYEFKMIKYWERLINLPQTHILKTAYHSLYNMSKNLVENNWCFTIKNILISVDMEQLWIEQTINKKDLLLVKEKLYSNFMTNTLNKINDTSLFPKLRTYKLFKCEYKLENYLVQLKDISGISALLKFRISSHNLRIETGRYERKQINGKVTKLPYNGRICKLCNDSVEDEIHFILRCSFFNIERQKMFERMRIDCLECTNSIGNDTQVFQQILTCKKRNCLESISIFLKTCFRKRNLNLFNKIQP